MAQRIMELDMNKMLKELRALPGFDDAFLQLERSKQLNTLIGWQIDGTLIEYTWIPLATGHRIIFGSRELTGEEADADYAPSNVEEN